MELRQLAIALLNDDEGINWGAFEILSAMLQEQKDCQDILDAIRVTDERVYLPSSFFPPPSLK